MAAKKNHPVAMAGEMPAYEPPTCLRVTKAQAGSVSVGDKITVRVSGTVKRVGETYDSGKFEIELKDSKVSGIDGNVADKEMERMMD